MAKRTLTVNINMNSSEMEKMCKKINELDNLLAQAKKLIVEIYSLVSIKT